MSTLGIVLTVVLTILATWALFVGLLFAVRPRDVPLKEVVKVLPNTVRLLHRISRDREVHFGVRIRLWMLFAYLALPIDIVPDFLPLIGYADDVVITAFVLRSVIRRAGPDTVRKHWSGSEEQLDLLWRAARLPGAPPAAH